MAKKTPDKAPVPVKPVVPKAAKGQLTLMVDLLKADPAKLDPAKLLALVIKIVTAALGSGVPWDVIIDLLTKKKLPVPAELKPQS